MTLAEMIDAVVSDTNRPDLGTVASGGDGQIPRAVFSATLSLHTIEYFYKDIVEINTIFPVSAYLQTLDTSTIPRYRALAYFRKWVPSTDSSGGFGVGSFGNMGFGNPNLTEVAGLWRNTSIPFSSSLLPPGIDWNGVTEDLIFRMIETVDLGGLFDSYGKQKQDVCYAAGTAIQIKSSTSLEAGKLGFYQYPSLDMEHNGVGYSSWIAREYPFAIIYSADAIIFANTGENEAARNLTRPSNYRTGDVGGLVTQHISSLKSSNIESVGR